MAEGSRPGHTFHRHGRGHVVIGREIVAQIVGEAEVSHGGASRGLRGERGDTRVLAVQYTVPVVAAATWLSSLAVVSISPNRSS